MVDNENLRSTVIVGLKKYLGVPIIRSAQNTEPPDYPYLSFTVTTLESANNGTWGVYPDGIDRIPVKQTWSITAQSEDELEAGELASKAREYLTHTGRTYLKDNDVIVETVTAITNRDSLITIEYEYRKGFDVVFWLMNEENNPIEEDGYINSVILNKE
ncbi:MAG: hypothetical protein LUD81_10545 [Clostridiales bacterium]|nr:hypothetical protein [Clostridiales bacterium]